MLQRTTNSGHNVGLATTSINGFEKKKLSNDAKKDDESFGKKTLNCLSLAKKALRKLAEGFAQDCVRWW